MNGWVRTLALVILAAAVVAAAAGISYRSGRRAGETKYRHVSGFGWDREEWARRSKGVRTSYNPDHDLNMETLTLVPGDERWLDFVFWCFNNKVIEHQVEAYGGTEWAGPQGGVIFHWAPGSRWETHTLASFGFTIGHVIGEHKWMDTMFPDFFEKYGGVHGVNVKDRLAEIDPASPKPWVEFLEYGGGMNSPYYRYLFHREALIDPVRERICLIGGQGVGFEYTFERFYHEAREVLTDAKAYQFFQLYDTFGPGFACRGGWAKNKLSPDVRRVYALDDEGRWAVKPGVAKPVKYVPNPPSPPIPDGLPEAEAVRRGQVVYNQQCTMCHGIEGDGNGFLGAGMDVRPRDFRQGWYKFRSTAGGQSAHLRGRRADRPRGGPEQHDAGVGAVPHAGADPRRLALRRHVLRAVHGRLEGVEEAPGDDGPRAPGGPRRPRPPGRRAVQVHRLQQLPRRPGPGRRPLGAHPEGQLGAPDRAHGPHVQMGVQERP